MKIFRFALVLIFGSLLAGCASIASKSDYNVVFRSVPDGAKVTVKNDKGRIVHSGATPTRAKLSASAGYFTPAQYYVDYEKTGYIPEKKALSANIDPWYIGNIGFGWFIGWLIVDPATGSMWQLDELVGATLKQDESSLPYKPEADLDNSPPINSVVQPFVAAITEEKPRDILPPSLSAPAEADVELADSVRTPDELMSSLKRIKRLRDEGALTEEEYEPRRKELVNKLLELESQEVK